MLLSIVIGDDHNRRVTVNKITNKQSHAIADSRRADILLPNEVLNIVVRISTSMFYSN